jgi:hypothetical protein
MALRLKFALNVTPFLLAGLAVACTGSHTVTCTDANVQLIQASNYDQSCATTSDCVAVGEGNACYPCAIACPTAAINASARAQYLSDVAKTSGSSQGDVTCNCPAEFAPCCRGGTCHADSQCQNPDLGIDGHTD